MEKVYVRACEWTFGFVFVVGTGGKRNHTSKIIGTVNLEVQKKAKHSFHPHKNELTYKICHRIKNKMWALVFLLYNHFQCVIYGM